MEASPGGLRLVVDTRGAVAPVTVDPVLAGSSWSAASDLADAEFGSSVALGDVNGDGHQDVLVGAARWRYTQAGGYGAAFLYLGSASGPSAAPDWSADGVASGVRGFADRVAAADVNGDGYDDLLVSLLSDEDLWVYFGSPGGLRASPDQVVVDVECRELTAAGDVNGDGYEDVLLSHPQLDSSFGKALVLHGSATGLALGWRGPSVAYAEYGYAVAAGDLNGDGYTDVAVGANSQDLGQLDEGVVYVHHGSAAGLSAAPTRTIEGNVEFRRFGSGLAATDVDGDGDDDLVVGDQDGSPVVYLGSVAGLAAAPALTLVSGDPDRELDWRVAAAGDLDGDGTGEVLVSSAHPIEPGSFYESRFLFLGSTAGLEPVPTVHLTDEQSWSGFASDFAAAGDVDGDGRDEFLVGADGEDDGEVDEGAAFLFSGDVLLDGDADGIVDLQDDCPAAPDPGQLDTDGDGIGNACDTPELAVVGYVAPGALATFAVTGMAPGERVLVGAAVGAPAAGPCPPVLGGLCLDLGPGAVLLGSAVADGTGTARLVVRAPAALQVQGAYVAQAAVARGAGGAASVKSSPLLIDGTILDHDGDGVSDDAEVAVGIDPTDADTDNDGTNDLDDLGPHLDPLDPDADGDGVLDGADRCVAGDDADDVDGDGVPTACDRCPADADPAQADADRDGLGDACEGAVLSAPAWVVVGSAEDASLGSSLASAGDVDGDGHDDVIVSAPYGDPDELGEVSLYAGTPAGLSAVPSWTTVGTGRQEWLGYRVAGAGDLDGDGYDDVVVSRSWSRNLVDVYHGSAAGLAPAPAVQLTPPDAGQQLTAVAAAGDVDGDGYGDLLAGGELSYGSAIYLFRGSATGVGTTPAIRLHDGNALASAGDVNGDGYDDVVVGDFRFDGAELDAGAVFVHLGSPSGPSAAPDWSVEGPNEDAIMGYAASAGDVNGDGYGDLVVGAPGYVDPGGDPSVGGAAFVYLGGRWGLGSEPAWTVTGTYGSFGALVRSAGDVNGDGYDDVLVGAPEQANAAWTASPGSTSVYLGSTTGLATTPAWRTLGTQDRARYGATAATGGDVDGDGRADVVVGVPWQDGAWGEQGAAVLYLGRTP